MNHALAAARTALVEIDQSASGEAIVAAVKGAIDKMRRASLPPEPTDAGTVERICAIGPVSVLRPELIRVPGA